MSRKTRFVIFAVAPSIFVALILVVASLWALNRGDPIDRGQDLNRMAWEATFRERGFPVPPGGPREGYWGSRLRGNRRHSDPAVNWIVEAMSSTGFVEIDREGCQRWRPAAAPEGEVLIVGASVAFGAYASAIDTTYFAVAGRKLEERGIPTEIVILATGAWKSGQEVAALRTYLASHSPRVIVFLNGLNDLTIGSRADTCYGEEVATRDGSPWSVLHHEHDYDARASVYLANMAEAADIAARAGSSLLIVLQPSLVEKHSLTRLERVLLAGSLQTHASAEAIAGAYESIRRGLADLEDSGKASWCDASRIFDREPETTFTDLWHFSDPAHEILGNALADRLGPLLEAAPRKQSSE